MGAYKDFNGTINLDVRDSKADWGPFTPKEAPSGAPNILFVLYDDTGLAAWSPYGGSGDCERSEQDGPDRVHIYSPLGNQKILFRVSPAPRILTSGMGELLQPKRQCDQNHAHNHRVSADDPEQRERARTRSHHDADAEQHRNHAA